MSKRLLFFLCAALACGVFVAACGGDDSGGGTAGTQQTGSTEGVKTIDPKSMDGAKGTVTYCSGKGTSVRHLGISSTATIAAMIRPAPSQATAVSRSSFSR